MRGRGYGARLGLWAAQCWRGLRAGARRGWYLLVSPDGLLPSIRLRLLVLLLGLLTLAGGLVGTVTYRQVLAQTEALMDYQLRQMALSLRNQGELTPEQAAPLADRELDFVVQIWSGDGRALYASRPHAALPAVARLGFADVQAGDQAWRTFSVAEGFRVIQVAQPRQIREKLAADAAWRGVAPLLWISPVLVALLWALSRWSLAPLERVARQVRTRDAQSLAPLPAADLPDEVEPLVGALNGLLQRLDQALEAQRAFVADAAHELRSPLTALKLQLQLLRQAPTDAARHEALDTLGEGITRATWLVEQLLALARNEPGAPALPFAELDLAEVARRALADAVPQALARNTELALMANGPVPMAGDATSLQVLVRNLVDNAVRHGPPDALVEVRVQAQGEDVLLTVDDAGLGIPPEDRERVFARFFRRTPSASDGSGLGLAIVRTIAERHGASVGLGISPLGGLRATVRFPRRPAPAELPCGAALSGRC